MSMSMNIDNTLNETETVKLCRFIAFWLHNPSTTKWSPYQIHCKVEWNGEKNKIYMYIYLY